MKYLIIIATVLILTAAGSFAAFNYLTNQAMTIPNNSPLQCQTDTTNKNIIVALGDSITHARVSANYLQRLSKKDENKQFTFINAGINSRLAYNALQAVDSVIACKPSVITILIGTNDVLATRSNQSTQYYINKWQLPQTPNFDFYQHNLKQIIEKLQQKTNAKIAILSLPPLGEELNSSINKTVSKYNALIKEITKHYNISYLPLNEHMWKYLSDKGNTDKACSFTDKKMEKAIAQHYLFNTSWNDISASNHLKLLTDCIHLNEDAAKIIADLIQNFLINTQPITR